MPGLSPLGDCARWRPCTSQNSPLNGTWQVAFLGETEPRAARPEISVPRRVESVASMRPRLSNLRAGTLSMERI